MWRPRKKKKKKTTKRTRISKRAISKRPRRKRKTKPTTRTRVGRNDAPGGQRERTSREALLADIGDRGLQRRRGQRLPRSGRQQNARRSGGCGDRRQSQLSRTASAPGHRHRALFRA